LKTLHRFLKIFEDLLGEHIRIGQIVEVSEGFVLDPEDIEVGFIAG